MLLRVQGNSLLRVQGNNGCNAPPGSHPRAGRFGALPDTVSFGTLAVAPPSPCAHALSRLVGNGKLRVAPPLPCTHAHSRLAATAEPGSLMLLYISLHSGNWDISHSGAHAWSKGKRENVPLCQFSCMVRSTASQGHSRLEGTSGWIHTTNLKTSCIR